MRMFFNIYMSCTERRGEREKKGSAAVDSIRCVAAAAAAATAAANST